MRTRLLMAFRGRTVELGLERLSRVRQAYRVYAGEQYVGLVRRETPAEARALNGRKGGLRWAAFAPWTADGRVPPVASERVGGREKTRAYAIELLLERSVAVGKLKEVW